MTRYLLDTNIISASAALALAASGFGARRNRLRFERASPFSDDHRMLGSKIGGIDSAGTLLRAPDHAPTGPSRK